MKLSNRIKRLRKNRNLRQEDLAKILGFSRTAVANYELGTRTPSVEVLCEIANFFNVSLDYLVGRTNIKDKNYQLSIEKQDSVILLINPETGRILDCSLKATEFYGQSKKEILSKYIWEINTLPKKIIFEKMDDAINNRQNIFKFTHQVEGGDIKGVQVYSGPVHLDNKNVLFSIVHQIPFNADQSDLSKIAASIANLSCSRVPYKIKHKQRVTDLALAIAAKMNLSKKEIDTLRLGALLHDIGLINIPLEIINKPAILTDLEYELIKQHPGAGKKVALNFGFNNSDIIDIIAHHHERIDGSGYPDGLSGNNINPLAKIVAVADVVEAMSSSRPYRNQYSQDEIINYLQANAGKKYDSRIVNICEDILIIDNKHNKM